MTPEFDSTKVYKMDGTPEGYEFIGYFFRSLKPKTFNNVVIGEDSMPVAFVPNNQMNYGFAYGFTRPMKEVAKPLYQVAFKDYKDRWAISVSKYESIEAFYAAGNLGVPKGAYLLVEKE